MTLTVLEFPIPVMVVVFFLVLYHIYNVCYYKEPVEHECWDCKHWLCYGCMKSNSLNLPPNEVCSVKNHDKMCKDFQSK